MTALATSGVSKGVRYTHPNGLTSRCVAFHHAPSLSYLEICSRDPLPRCALVEGPPSLNSGGSEEVAIAIVGSMVVVEGGKVTAFEGAFIRVTAVAVVTVALIDAVVRAEA